jgi:hypothetical protein
MTEFVRKLDNERESFAMVCSWETKVLMLESGRCVDYFGSAGRVRVAKQTTRRVRMPNLVNENTRMKEKDRPAKAVVSISSLLPSVCYSTSKHTNQI